MFRRGRALLSTAATALFYLCGPAAAAEPKILTTIKPLHSIASAVMAGGAAKPALLLGGTSTPHAYSLKPSDARALSSADLVLWVGPGLEGFLEKPLRSLVGEDRLLSVISLPGLIRHRLRRGGVWEGRNRFSDAHDHAHGDGHRHDAGPGATDPHIWLDPRNGAVIALSLAERLARIDPAGAARYRDNAGRFAAAMTALDAELRTRLAPVRQRGFVVFHDAYQYFEVRYGLRAVGAVTLSADRPPGPRRIAAIRNAIRTSGAQCLFREPQFPPRIIDVIARGNPGVRVAVLDPIGAAMKPDAAQYPALLRALADAFVACLAP